MCPLGVVGPRTYRLLQVEQRVERAPRARFGAREVVEVARVLGLRVVAASMKAEKTKGAPPTVESSQYKLYATEFSRRLANASMDIGGPGSQPSDLSHVQPLVPHLQIQSGATTDFSQVAELLHERAL